MYFCEMMIRQIVRAITIMKKVLEDITINRKTSRPSDKQIKIKKSLIHYFL